MSTNQGPEYFIAEKRYYQSQTDQERILWLEEMIRNFKKHKGSENMLAELKKRLIKFKEKQEKNRKVGKTTKKGIRKDGFQVVLLGLPNAGKSSLLSSLTNARPNISEYPFATIQPEIGTLDYQGVKAQIIDLPSIGSEYFDVGIVNTADCIVVIIEKLEDLEKVSPYLSKNNCKKIIVLNKSETLSEFELRKLQEKIKSKKLDALIVSTKTDIGIEELKGRIFNTMNVIRVYTKEPGKTHSNIPSVLPINSTVKTAAESIRKGFSYTIKETRVTGPSSKFPNQKVGLTHVLKDKDIIEFHTR